MQQAVEDLFSEVVPSSLWWSSMPQDSDVLEKYKVDTVYDIADEDSTDDVDIRSGRTYVKYSFVDGPEFDADNVVRLGERLATDVVAGHRVLVHCTYGKNRSGLIVAIALRRLHGLTGKEALDRVRSLRPRAVNNEAFASFLESLSAPTSS